MSKAPVVDTHQHFWRAPASDQKWRKPGHELLARAFLPDELAADLARVGVDGTVAVQSVNTLGETETLLQIAMETEYVWGVVGWVPLDDPVATAAAIERFASQPALKGIRHLINTEPDPDWVVQDAVVESLGLLAEAGLTFDVVAITEAHLDHVVTLAERVPGLRLIVDHLARPPVLDQGWEPWASQVARAAEASNVYMKLSAGIDVVTDWPSWSGQELEPYVHWVLSQFGPERTMFASNWPVVLLAGSYELAWRETNRTLAVLDADARSAVLGETAIDAYRLQPPT